MHDALLLARLLPARTPGQPLRLADVAAPIVRHGRSVAVLGAHLDWAWAEERRRALLRRRRGAARHGTAGVPPQR